MMTRRPILLVGVVAGMLACGGAAGKEDAVRSAFECLVRALDERDAAALWALADDETQALFEGLASDVNDALERIERCWPEDLRAEARKAVGGDYLYRGGRGEDLFRAVLDPALLKGPQDPEARRVLRVVASRREALVVTGTHDTFHFVPDREGRWRTDLLGKAFTKKSALSDLRRNLEAVRRDCPGEPLSSPSGGAE